MWLSLQRFLRENGLQLVIRSHEGPDARYDRDDMPPMIPGYSVDHVTASADQPVPSSTRLSPDQSASLAGITNR